MAGFIFDARAALDEIQGRTPATTATTATNPAFQPGKSQLSQPMPVENATLAAPDPDGFGPLLELRRLPNVHIRTSLHNPSRERLLY